MITFVETSSEHLLQDHETRGIVVDDEDSQTRRKLVGNGVVRLPSRHRSRSRHRSLSVTQIHLSPKPQKLLKKVLFFSLSLSSLFGKLKQSPDEENYMLDCDYSTNQARAMKWIFAIVFIVCLCFSSVNQIPF